MGYKESIDMQYDLNGNIVEKDSIGELIEKGFTETSGEIIGDANANGTAIYVKEVPAGEILVVDKMILTNRVATCCFIVCESDTNGVGGVETPILDLDINGVGSIALGLQGKPLFFINNVGGLASVYLVVYAPQNRLGAGGNNAVTQFWSCSCGGKVES